MRYVTSLISGVGIFFLGFGLSMYHGVIGLTDPTPVESYNFAFFVLAGSLGSEGVTLLMAINSVLKGAKAAEMKVTEYSKSCLFISVGVNANFVLISLFDNNSLLFFST